MKLGVSNVTGIDFRSGIVCDDKAFLYFPIPKVANSSIKVYLADLMNIDYAKDNDSFMHRINFKRVAYDGLHNYKDYLKIAVVRNPWSRIVSCYVDKIVAESEESGVTAFGRAKRLFPEYYSDVEPGISFEKFVDIVCEIPDKYSDVHFISQYNFLYDDENIKILKRSDRLRRIAVRKTFIDYFCRFERLGADFSNILKILDISGGQDDLSFYKKSKQYNYKDFYNRRVIKKVENRYYEDINILGYNFDGIVSSRLKSRDSKVALDQLNIPFLNKMSVTNK